MDRRRGGRSRLRQGALLSVLSMAGPASRALAHTPPHPLSDFQAPVVDLDPNVTLSVGPTLLISSGEWVTITWSRIDSYNYPDAFVAAFSPGTVLEDPARITEVAPVKYQFISASGPVTTDGAGGDAGTKDEVTAWENAAQALRFRLLNLRDPEGYGFGLFKGGILNPVLVAKTDQLVTFAQPYEVLHVHLALAEESSSMRVSWVTGHASRAPAVSVRAVRVDSDEQPEPWEVITAGTITYRREDMCGAPATTNGFHDPGLLHSVVLTELEACALYEYRPGDVEADEWAGSSFFRGPPLSVEDPDSPEISPRPSSSRARDTLAGKSTNPVPSTVPEDEAGWQWGPGVVKIAVFGDMGTAEADGSQDAGHTEELPSLKTVAILKEKLGIGVPVGTEASTEAGNGNAIGLNLQLVVHIGDLSYARGYDTQWDEYLDQISPIASRVPWMVSVGNHERDSPTTSISPVRKELPYYTGEDSGGGCGVPTAFRFLMPGAAGDPLADAPWYSFDFGPVHFTMMSTEHDFTPGSPQHEFLKADLEGVDRGKTPWLVFTGHRPMYVNSGGPGAGDCEGEQEGHCANDQPVAALLRSSLEHMLVENEVDLALYGHHHSYQRTCKVIDEVCMGTSSGYPGAAGYEGDGEYVAPVHVIVGMAGKGLSQNLVDPPPSWIEFATDRQYGLGMIMADRRTLKLTFFKDSDGEVADEMWLTRPLESSSSYESAGYDHLTGRAGGAEGRSKALRTAIRKGAMLRSKRATW